MSLLDTNLFLIFGYFWIFFAMAATIPEVREDGVNIQGMNMSCPEEDRQPPIWIDDETSLPMDSLLIPMHYDGMIDSILVPKGLIADI